MSTREYLPSQQTPATHGLALKASPLPPMTLTDFLWLSTAPSAIVAYAFIVGVGRLFMGSLTGEDGVMSALRDLVVAVPLMISLLGPVAVVHYYWDRHRLSKPGEEVRFLWRKAGSIKPVLLTFHNVGGVIVEGSRRGFGNG